MFFSAVPTPGSSGGPIVDLETGSVIGVIKGSRLDNHISGLRGWATSSESIYEVGIDWSVWRHTDQNPRCLLCQASV